MSTVDQVCHVEDVIILFEFLLWRGGIPFGSVGWVDPGLAFIDLENLLTVFLSECTGKERKSRTDTM